MRKLTGLSEEVCGLDGTALIENGRVITVGFLIANALARGASAEPIRAMDIALRVYNADGVLELEDADFALAREAVEKDTLMSNLAKAPTLKFLTKAAG